MTTPKHAQAAAIVRAQVTDGTLRPGQAAPSGAQLARLTGFAALTCRRALRDLVTDGTLTRGVSPHARPRVAGQPSPQPPAAGPPALARVTLHWSDGTESVISPPPGPGTVA